MSQTEQQEEEVAENASNKRKWEGHYKSECPIVKFHKHMDMIHGRVRASKPKIMQDAIEVATKLRNKKISTLVECQTENKKRIQQYLQHEQYALWEVIEFGDFYEAPNDDVATGSATEGTGKKKRKKVALTTEDMQKRKNDRNRSDLDTMSLDDLYNHLKVYESEVQKKSKSNSQNMAFISSAKNNSGKEDFNTASIPTASTNVSPASVNIGAKKTGKKISIQGADVAGFDKSKMECFNCHKMSHFAKECRAPRSQDKGRRDNYRQGGVSISISPVTEIPVAEVPTGNGSIPTASPPATGVPTGSDVVPTVSPIFTTATDSIPYTRRKGKEKMVESETPKKKKLQEQIDVQVTRELEKEMARDAQRMNEQIARDAEIARIHAEEELQMMIDGLDRNNETVAKYLQEYHQFATELPIGRRIELISDLVKYQDNYAKVLKFQTQQRKPLSRKQQRDFYMSVLRSHAEKLKEMMQLIPVEEVYVEALQVKHPIIDWEVHTEGQRSYWKIIRLGGSSASYQFFVDLLKHLDREDLNQLWALVKETLNIRPATNDKEKELWVELKRLYKPYVKNLLWTHTQNLMHAPVEWKLYDTCGVHHAEQVPTANEDKLPLLSQSDATAEKLYAAAEVKE
nr:hypothetical protein [Tanacetum cinerariifolium]